MINDAQAKKEDKDQVKEFTSGSKQGIIFPGGRTYENFGYNVFIGWDGAIQVKGNDWLSKYSCAIHGNPWQVKNEFARLRKSGDIEEYEIIKDTDLIIANEIIYHIPSMPEKTDTDELAFEPVIYTEKLKKDELLKLINNLENLNPEYLETLGEISSVIDITNNITEFLIILEDVSALSRVGSVAGQVSHYLGPIAILAGIISMLKNLLDAVSAGRRGFASQAMIDTIAAWAFGQERPRPEGSTALNHVLSAEPPSDEILWKNAYNESVEETYKMLDLEAWKPYLPRIVNEENSDFDASIIIKIKLRLACQNKPYILRRMLAEKIDVYAGWPMSVAAQSFEQSE